MQHTLQNTDIEWIRPLSSARNTCPWAVYGQKDNNLLHFILIGLFPSFQTCKLEGQHWTYFELKYILYTDNVIQGFFAL